MKQTFYQYVAMHLDESIPTQKIREIAATWRTKVAQITQELEQESQQYARNSNNSNLEKKEVPIPRHPYMDYIEDNWITSKGEIIPYEKLSQKELEYILLTYYEGNLDTSYKVKILKLLCKNNESLYYRLLVYLGDSFFDDSLSVWNNTQVKQIINEVYANE